MHEAVFVAAAMVATSVGITARVLRDLNVHKSRPAQIILGAAVFDDILGMLLLGVLVSTVSTEASSGCISAWSPWKQLALRYS